MKPATYIAGTAIALINIVFQAGAVGPREPLTFKNFGLYGGWNEYFVSKDSPFDFLIVQARVTDGKIDWYGQGNDPRTWNEWLKIARANGKRVIAVVSASLLVDGEKQAFRELYTTEKPAPVEQFFPVFDQFFEQVDEQELYAITISEEHVFWNGQQERLEKAYAYLKAKYDVPLYQWYTPAESGATAGLNYPNLPADGWAVDEYFIKQPVVEAAMRMYTIMQKPAFQIIWAAPDMPSAPWSPTTFWDQYAVCRKYDIPVAFFLWTGPNDTPNSNTWSWEPNVSPRMREIFEDYCLSAIRLAQRLPAVPQGDWDYVPWAPKRIKLQPGTGETKAAYEDTFVKLREIASWSDAQFTGFANLKWDSSPLQLAPRVAGDAESTVRYCFETTGKPSAIVVNITGKTSNGSLEVQLRDTHDNLLAKSTLNGESAKIRFDASPLKDTCFVVQVRLSGRAEKAGTVLAEFTSIRVEADFSAAGK